MDEHTSKTQTHELSYYLGLSVLLSVLITILLIGLFLKYAPPHLITKLLNTPSPAEEFAKQAANDSTIPNVVEKVSPAVVSITISADVPVIEQYFEEYNPFGGIFGPGFGFQIPQQRQIGTEKRTVGGGTGFFVSADGYIITNKHVVDAESASYTAITNAGKKYTVKVVAKDPSLDIAVLKVTDTTETFPYLTFGDPASLRLGASVIAIGNALAEFPNSISVGVISGLSRNIVAGDMRGSFESLEGVIQTDAAINRGNSGGPLLNLRGEVIGVNVAVAGNSENIGFALPVDTVKSVFESVRDTGEIVRPFAGIRYVQITEELMQANKLSVDHGILIIRGQNTTELAVLPGSPADKAGLVENDIVLEVDGKKLDGQESFANIVRRHKVGDTLKLLVFHNGEKKEVNLTLEKTPS